MNNSVILLLKFLTFLRRESTLFWTFFTWLCLRITFLVEVVIDDLSVTPKAYKFSFDIVFMKLIINCATSTDLWTKSSFTIMFLCMLVKAIMWSSSTKFKYSLNFVISPNKKYYTICLDPAKGVFLTNLSLDLDHSTFTEASLDTSTSNIRVSFSITVSFK